MKEPIFNASLTIEATPEEAEALNKSNSTVDEETRQTFRHALEMQEASLPKGRIARLKSKQVNKFTTPLWQIEDSLYAQDGTAIPSGKSMSGYMVVKVPDGWNKVELQSRQGTFEINSSDFQ